MLREMLVGLCVLSSIGCGDEGTAESPARRAFATNGDGGVGPDRCFWIEHWRTDIFQAEPCRWRIRSRDTSVALLVSEFGQCLTAETICGTPACSDIDDVSDNQIVGIWGPPELDHETVWSATESFDCE